MLRFALIFIFLIAFWGLMASGAGQAEGVARRHKSRHFVEVTQEAGLDYRQHTPLPEARCLTQAVEGPCEVDWLTGGAAVADVDGDGRPDLFVTRLDAHDLLFRNLGDGRFEDASEASGLASHVLQSNGAGFADLDNDGDADLYVTTLGSGQEAPNDRFHLFINDGRGVFSEEALARGAALHSATPRAGFGVAFGDYDRDGWVDIHATEWLGRVTRPGESTHARLLRNRGAAAPGHFEDVTESAGVVVDRDPRCLEGGECIARAFASAFADLDADGWPELVVTADFGRSVLFWNNGDGTFRDGTREAGVGTDENGMGSTIADLDGDGDLDWFVTSIYDPNDTCAEAPCTWGTSGNRLYLNQGDRHFEDATDRFGVRDGRWGWGAVFFDAENDGDLDLAMTNGFDLPFTEVETAFNRDPFRLFLNRLLNRIPSRMRRRPYMREAALRRGIDHRETGRGLLSFDYDQDGDVDLFVVDNAGRGHLYRNDRGQRRGFLRVDVRGQALGARVELSNRRGRVQITRSVASSSHFLGQSERIVHFGLGRRFARHRVRRSDRRPFELSVQWPNGESMRWSGLAANTSWIVWPDGRIEAVDSSGRE